MYRNSSLVIKCITLLIIIGIFLKMYGFETWWALNESHKIASETVNDHFEPIHVLPHSIIIGVAKCGTYALKRMMEDIYPNVFAARGEVRFFTEHYDEGIESYKKKLPPMKSPQDIIIEKSPGYFVHSEAALRIYKDSPKSKLILIVCDPVRRMFSHWLHEVSERNRYLRRDGIGRYLILGNGEWDTRHFKHSLYGH